MKLSLCTLVLAALAACPNNSVPVAEVTFNKGECIPATVANITFVKFNIADPLPQNCEPGPTTVDWDFGDKPVTVAATNQNNTLCYHRQDAVVSIVDDRATVDVPSAELDCAQSKRCPNHVEEMNPIYEFALELFGQSMELCSSQLAIAVAELLLSNGIDRKPPSGDHVEGQMGFSKRGTVDLRDPRPYLAADDRPLYGLTPFVGFDFQAPNNLARVRPAEPPPGDYFMFAQVLKGNVPEHDPVNYYQYAFVFDADGNASNNYQPLPQYPADFFKGTDRWYELLYTPAAGWSVKASTAINSQIRPAQSAATLYIVGAVIFLLVPASEFDVPNPSYRFTAFRHKGDYGLNPPHDFSGYVDPPVADGLHAFTP